MAVVVVVVESSVVVEVGSTMIVVGNHGCEFVTVDIGGMLVTPGSELLGAASLLGVTLSLLVLVGRSVVDGVWGGRVLLKVGRGTEVLGEMVGDVITGGSCGSVVVVPLLPGPIVVDGMLALVLVLGVEVTVPFEIVGKESPLEMGGREVSPLEVGVIVVLVAGGGVSVVTPLVVVGTSVLLDPVDMPVPGPVEVVGVTVVEVPFCVGFKMLEMAELMLLTIELMGLPGSLVLDVFVVTMPVGARIISELVVESVTELVASSSSSDDEELVDVEVAVLLLEG